MTIIADITIPNSREAPDSTPMRIVSDYPNIRLEVENFVTLDSSALVYILVDTERFEGFKRDLRRDPQITDVRCLEDVDDTNLYKVKWDVDSPVVHCINQTDGVIMQAVGTVDEWDLTIWFDYRGAASNFQQCCIARDVPLEVNRLCSLTNMIEENDVGLTARQREVLVMAYENGYFEQPREVTQQELANELGISSSAVGSRLHRGMARLIEQMVLR